MAEDQTASERPDGPSENERPVGPAESERPVGPAESGRPDDHPADDAASGERLVVLFDGVCNLCSGFVQFVIPRDPEGRFAFASLQSDVAADLLNGHEVDPDALESIVLLEGEDAYVKSGAILRICYHLGGVYRLLWPCRVLPSRLRNWVYDLVANRRYRWFGKKDRCMVPQDDVADRFLE